MSDYLRRMLDSMRNRIANIVARGVVGRTDDSKKLQVVQLDVLDGETRENCERLQEYGFTSVPNDGAEAVVLFVGGRRDHGLVIAVDDRRYRLVGLQKGEVALYHKDGGHVHFKADGSLEIAPKNGADVNIVNAANVTVQGTAKVEVTAPIVNVGDAATTVTLAGGALPVARVGDVINGTAGPYPISAVIGAGNPKVKA